jgi:type III pantothenate kinase
MNLIVDVGNTLVKLAVFESDILQHKKTCLKLDFLDTLEDISENYTAITNCAISSVGNLSDKQRKRLEKLYPVFEVTYTTPMPFINTYTTPATLGVDRMVLMSAAALQYASRNVLVIDAGSAITYDFLSNKNEYLGGAISPGIGMRYNALHNFTAKLPLLDSNLPKKLIGDSTTSSMHSGVIHGVLYEIDGFITDYLKNYSNLTVILTGGDAHFLRDSLKNDIFANSNFLLEGLNHILEHNKD